jgi:hypothetical protein
MSMAINTPGYPSGCSSSGINLKFIPYTPTINVSGKKNAVKTVYFNNSYFSDRYKKKNND